MKLYRYLKLNENWKKWLPDILLNNKWKFTNPLSQNDPFDCKLKVDFLNGTDFEFIDYLKMNAGKNTRNDAEFLHSLRYKNSFLMDSILDDDPHFFLSFSKSPDNLLMWAHYADSHKGIVLGIEIDDPDNNKVHPIQYVEDFIGIKQLNEMQTAVDQTGNSKALVEHVLTEKSMDWAYEQEYRIISREKEDVYPDIHVSQIIYGHKFGEKEKVWIKNLIQQHSLKIEQKKVELNRRRFKLDVVPDNEEAKK